MLILTRRFEEKIVLEDPQNSRSKIIVMPLDAGRSSKSVRLGIIAPNEIKIYREEIYNKYSNVVPIEIYS